MALPFRKVMGLAPRGAGRLLKPDICLGRLKAGLTGVGRSFRSPGFEGAVMRGEP